MLTYCRSAAQKETGWIAERLVISGKSNSTGMAESRLYETSFREAGPHRHYKPYRDEVWLIFQWFQKARRRRCEAGVRRNTEEEATSLRSQFLEVLEEVAGF